MADIINFNKARKRRDKQAAETLAAENRVRFGRTKDQKQLEAAQLIEAQRRLDQLHRESSTADAADASATLDTCAETPIDKPT